jgi:hypothetical protein
MQTTNLVQEIYLIPAHPSREYDMSDVNYITRTSLLDSCASFSRVKIVRMTTLSFYWGQLECANLPQIPRPRLQHTRHELHLMCRNNNCHCRETLDLSRSHITFHTLYLIRRRWERATLQSSTPYAHATAKSTHIPSGSTRECIARMSCAYVCLLLGNGSYGYPNTYR